MDDSIKSDKVKRLLKSSDLRTAEAAELVEEIARSIEDPDSRTWALRLLVKELAEMKQWDRAEKIARSIEGIGSSQSLGDLADKLLGFGEWDSAEKIARSIETSYERALSFTEIASRLVTANQLERVVLILDEAERVTQSISDSHETAWVLYRIARTFVDAGIYDTAETVARSIQSSYEKATALTEIVVRLLADGEVERAVTVLGDVETVARNGEMDWVWQRAEVFGQAAKLFSAAKQPDDATRVWMEAISFARSGEENENVQDSVDCAKVMKEIALEMALAGEYEAAQEAAKTIRNVRIRDSAISAVLKTAPAPNQ